MICGELAACALCVCERVPLPQSWSLNDCAVPPTSCLSQRALRFSLPRLRHNCFVRAVPLADEAFLPASDSIIAQRATCGRALLLTNPGCNLFTSRTPGCECRSGATSATVASSRCRANSINQEQNERYRAHPDIAIRISASCRDLPARDNGPGCGCDDTRTTEPTDVGYSNLGKLMKSEGRS